MRFIKIMILLAVVLAGCQQKKEDTPEPDQNKQTPQQQKTYSFQMYQDVRNLDKFYTSYDAGTFIDAMLDTTNFIFKYTTDSVLWATYSAGDLVMMVDTLALYATVIAPADLNYYHGSNDWMKFTWIAATPVPVDSAEYLKVQTGWSSYVNASSPNDPYPVANESTILMKKVPDKYYPMYKSRLPAVWKSLTDSLYAHPKIN